MTKRKKRDPLDVMKKYKHAASEIATHSPLLAKLFRRCIGDLKRARERTPKRDPLAALRNRYPGKWRVNSSNGTHPLTGREAKDYHVHCDYYWILTTQDRLLARAIAKLGAK